MRPTNIEGNNLHSEEEIDLDFNRLQNGLRIIDLNYPGFNFKLDDVRLVQFKEDLFFKVDLKVNFGLYFKQDKTYSKSELLMDNKLLRQFSNNVVYRKGYLTDEGNYFNVNPDVLKQEGHLTVLRNSRVFLYWRDVLLKDTDIKRIISLGFLFLLGSIDEARLYERIYKILSSGTFIVNISYQTNRYVSISIEPELFKF